MSTEPVAEPTILLDANGMPIETWGGKFERKFKENPFVPVREFPLPLPNKSSPTQHHPTPLCTQWPD